MGEACLSSASETNTLVTKLPGKLTMRLEVYILCLAMPGFCGQNPGSRCNQTTLPPPMFAAANMSACTSILATTILDPNRYMGFRKIRGTYLDLFGVSSKIGL